jgi:hypothetical protein
MRTQWPQQHQKQIEIQRELPKIQPNFLMFECIYGKHTAEILHRGTAYCRACYDERNPYRKTIDP